MGLSVHEFSNGVPNFTQEIAVFCPHAGIKRGRQTKKNEKAKKKKEMGYLLSNSLQPHLHQPNEEFPNQCPKDPTVLKTLRDSELLRRSVFTTPPDLLRREPLFEGRNACKTQENSASAGVVAIVNPCAIANLLCIVNLLRRSIFSTAGSFGWGYQFAREALKDHF